MATFGKQFKLASTILIMSSLFSACANNEEIAFKSRSADALKHSNNEYSTTRTAANSHELDIEDFGIENISTDKVESKFLPLIVEATGQLQPNSSSVTRIAAPVNGKIMSINCALGEMVKKGKTLATISSQELNELITDLFKNENEANSDLSKELLSIECELKQAKAEEVLCRKQYNRAKLLLEEKISPVSAVEALETELEKHKNNIQALDEKDKKLRKLTADKIQLAQQGFRQKLLLLGMSDVSITTILEERRVVNTVPLFTPQSGFVLERNVNVGELVDSSKTLFIVDDIDTLWLTADIFEQDIKHVKTGQKIEFTVDSYPNEKFQGNLDFVAGTINQDTRTLSVRAVITNPGLKLKPKMFARMRINTGNNKVFGIAKAAIQSAGSHKVVYVQKAGRHFEERSVKLGEEFGEYVEILEGLNSGEQVVTKGSFDLRSHFLRHAG